MISCYLNGGFQVSWIKQILHFAGLFAEIWDVYMYIKYRSLKKPEEKKPKKKFKMKKELLNVMKNIFFFLAPLRIK